MNAENTAVERARELFRAGRYAEAESTLTTAFRNGLVPGASAFWLLADIEKELGHPEREIRALEGLLAVFRADDDTVIGRLWARAAMLRERLGDPDGALAAWKSAVGTAPDIPELHRGLARARLNAQEIAGVAVSASELLNRFPRHVFSHVYHGHMKKALGDRAAAAASYRHALVLDPGCGEALYNLAEMHQADGSESLLTQATELVNREDAAAADLINAAFAAARVLDREGRFRQALDYLALANQWAQSECERRGLRYDRDAEEASVARIMSDYPRTAFDTAIGSLPIELVPIFVIGPPRSGTTLIEQILSCHSQVEAAGEITAAPRCESAFRRARSAAGRDGPLDPADATDAELLENARERYIDALFERGLSGPRVVDKLPANFRIAGFLRAMFPDSPIVHCVRDLRATGFSLYNANFGAHEPWYHDLGHIAHYLRLYRKLMSHWQDVLDPPCIDVSYEQLVANPEKQIAVLLENADLPFEPACLEFYRNDRPVLTASHEQVRQPAYTSAIDHWRNYSDWLGPVAELPPR